MQSAIFDCGCDFTKINPGVEGLHQRNVTRGPVSLCDAWYSKAMSSRLVAGANPQDSIRELQGSAWPGRCKACKDCMEGIQETQMHDLYVEINKRQQAEAESAKAAEWINLSRIAIDPNICPRTALSDSHIEAMQEAVNAGEMLPPILVDRKSMRIIDGYHRYERAKRAKESQMLAVLRDFTDEQSVFEAAIAANARHGFSYAPFDRKRIVDIAINLKMSVERIAGALNITTEKVAELRRGVDGARKLPAASFQPTAQKPRFKNAINKNSQASVARVQDAMERTKGEAQMHYVNQLVLAIQSGMLDRKQDRLPYALHKLATLIQEKVPLHADAR